ncbi:MAG: DUF4169 family protein [Paracoccaceae bacterium]
MAEIVTLNVARKARDKAAAKARADENAAKHGRTKALKVLEKALAEKAQAGLDGHRRDGD